VAGPVELGFLLRQGDWLGLDGEEAHGEASRAEPWRAKVGVDGSEREVDGAWLGAERGGGLGEDGMAEAGKEARVGGVERELAGKGRRCGAGCGGESVAVGWGGEKREEGEVFGEGGGAERAGEGDALGAERAAEGGGACGGGGGGREGDDARPAEGVTAREDARHSGGGVEWGEAHRALRGFCILRWRCGRHDRRLLESARLGAAYRRPARDVRGELRCPPRRRLGLRRRRRVRNITLLAMPSAAAAGG